MMEFPCADISNGAGQLSLISENRIFKQRPFEKLAGFERRKVVGRDLDYSYVFLLRIDTSMLTKLGRDCVIGSRGAGCRSQLLGQSNRGHDMVMFTIERHLELPIERWKRFTGEVADQIETTYQMVLESPQRLRSTR